MKFGFDIEVTAITSRRITARVDDELASPSGFDVFAARAMAGLATGRADHLRRFDVNAGMRTGGKDTGDIRVAIKTSFVTDELCAGNRRRLDNGLPENGAGKCEKQTR